MTFAYTEAPSAAAQAFTKSKELCALVYSQGFGQTKVAYSKVDFDNNLNTLFPKATQAAGRIAGSDEQNFWMDGDQVVGIWNDEHAVGVTGYSNRLPVLN